MVTVQLRDAANPEKVLVGPLSLPFEPREHKPLYIRRRFNDTKSTGYLITEVYCYEISTDEPERSGIVYLARQIDA